jgi:hypothetical protein
MKHFCDFQMRGLGSLLRALLHHVILIKRSAIAPTRHSSALLPLLVLMVALLSSNHTQAAALVPFGSIWKYLDDGSNQSNAWRTADFEDDGWASGPGQFGYGDGDEATEVSYGTNAELKHITTYFRTVFNVPDTNAFTNLVLNIIRDDGAVVYLNGVEVFRSGMAAGTVSYTTLATSNGENSTGTTNVSPARLVNGANLIAVEVHQNDPDSSDLSFDLELTDGRSDSPNVSIVSPINNASIAGPGNLTVTVSAIDPNGVVTNVQLFSGNTLLGVKANAPFTFIWTNAPSGAHILSATARDNDGLLTLSKTTRIVIGNGGSSNLVLLPAGSLWKYLDNGSNQGQAWRSNTFNDAGWSNGVAQLGYGDGDEVTTISYGPSSTAKFITTYFRRTFVISNIAQINPLGLRVLSDDGAVVYLNGAEVFRSNMPTGAVNHLTEALLSLSSPEEDTFIKTNLSTSGLIVGTNLIAAEIHQVSGSSSDLSFDLELLGSDYPSVLRGPWLNSVSWSNAVVKWRTSVDVNGRVRFGTNPVNLNFMVTGGVNDEHRLDLTNLAPKTKYYYSIGLTNGVLLSGPDYHFITPPLPGTRQPMRFWALGDAGTADVNQFNVRDAFYRMNGTNKLDAILMLGDNAYNAGTDSEYQRAVFDCYPTALRNTPLWSTIGNHETDQSTTPSSTIPYYQIFSLPQDGEVGGLASGTEDYYSFDYGNIHFVCLDSMTSSRSVTGTMAMWLTNDLAATTQDWLIAFWHHPPYTKGSHNSDTESQLVQMRQNILPILEAYGVDLVLCGHSHAYERSHLIDGHYGLSGTITPAMKLNTGGGRVQGAGAYVKPPGLTANEGAVYVVAGSAGKVSGGSFDHSAMFLSLNRLGSLYFEVSSNRLDATFLRETGLTNDTFTIIKGNTINVADVGVTERDTTQTNAVFMLTMAQTSAVPVTVSFAAGSESALLGVDFSAMSGMVTFNPGVRTQMVVVPVIGDLLIETNETFALNLFGNPLLVRSLARGTIFDNDNTNVVVAPTLGSVSRSNHVVFLRWPTVNGLTYRVEYKNDLNATQWQIFQPPISGNGSLYQFTDLTATNVPQRFYRVSVE